MHIQHFHLLVIQNAVAPRGRTISRRQLLRAGDRDAKQTCTSSSFIDMSAENDYIGCISDAVITLEADGCIPNVHNLQLVPVISLSIPLCVSAMDYQMADRDLGFGIFAVWGQSSGISRRNQSSTENRSVRSTIPNYQSRHGDTETNTQWSWERAKVCLKVEL